MQRKTSPKGNFRNFKYTIALVLIFIIFAVYNDDPSGFSELFVEGIAYLSCIVLTFAGFGFTKGRRRTIYVVLVAAAILISSYLLTGGNGAPVQGAMASTTCSNVQVPNATSPTGFVYGDRCTDNLYYDPTSIAYNAAFWIPLVGAAIFAMPSWLEPAGRSALSEISRILKGSVPSGTILFLTFGLFRSSFGYPQIFTGYSPLNPFYAYNYCDSTTYFVVSCVQTNALTYLADFLFWVAIVSLIALLASELYDFFMSAYFRKRGTYPIATESPKSGG